MSELTMEKLVSLCKRRGFVFPSSEIYGGLGAIYDYGHYGTLLKNNIQTSWWKSMIQKRDDVISLDSAIFVHPQTWQASGHVDNFDDPQVDCKKCRHRFRADHLLEEAGIDADKASLGFIDKKIKELKIKCPSCGSLDLSPTKRFSLMVKSNLGSPTEEWKEENVVYLRPETCGGIYLQYKNCLDSTHPKLPFGIAQVGKAFRNEIVARQFIFRTREFEQLEMQYFTFPEEVKKTYEDWKNYRWDWYLELGLEEKDLRWQKHQKLAHYAKEAYDLEYNFRSLGGFKEVEGLHSRGDWDLGQHSKSSGVDLSYFSEEKKERFLPHIVESSAGLGRLFLMIIDKAYCEETLENGEGRIVLKLPKKLAPIKIAIFPLLKNKEELVSKAREIYNDLKEDYMCEFDDSGNIGKRYRRQDEIGTPYCLTVDFDTLEKKTITIRDRDTMQQESIPLANLKKYLQEKLG